MFTRARNFCFTLNNPTELERVFWTSLADSERARNQVQATYVVYQEERHDTPMVLPWTSTSGNTLERTITTRGTPHLQGYVELSRAIRLAGIKRRFGQRCHFERRRGTQAQCVAYCQKEDTRLTGGDAGEGGELKRLGKDKLSVVAALLQEGADVSTLSHDYAATFIKYGAKITTYALSQMPDRNEAPSIIILYGKSGTGKTAEARKRWPDAYWVPRPQKGGWWWTNYMGEKTILLDEWRKGLCAFGFCLILLDRYACTVQQKGACMKMLATTIIITTNVDPIRWYPGMTWEDREPLRRRIRDFAEIWDVDEDSKWDDFQYTVRETISIT